MFWVISCPHANIVSTFSVCYAFLLHPQLIVLNKIDSVHMYHKMRCHCSRNRGLRWEVKKIAKQPKMEVAQEIETLSSSIVIPQEWSDATQSIVNNYVSSSPPIAIVCGPNYCGKTTFSLNLVNVLLRRYVFNLVNDHFWRVLFWFCGEYGALMDGFVWRGCNILSFNVKYWS